MEAVETVETEANNKNYKHNYYVVNVVEELTGKREAEKWINEYVLPENTIIIKGREIETTEKVTKVLN